MPSRIFQRRQPWGHVRWQALVAHDGSRRVIISDRIAGISRARPKLAAIPMSKVYWCWTRKGAGTPGCCTRCNGSIVPLLVFNR